MREFSSLHPLALFLYFMSIFAIAIITLQPAMVLIFLVCTTLFYIQACSWEAFKKSLPFKVLMFVLIAFSNPLFVHQGVSVIGYMSGNPITIEAILYGVNFAFMMLGIWNLCACYQAIMDNEKFIYLFGCMLPSFALLVSMALRLIPKFKKQLAIIHDSQSMLRVETADRNFIVRASAMLSTFSILITWAFETSIVSADSMKARGYGTRRRINFHNYHFGKRDAIFMLTCFMMSMVIVVIYQREYQHFYFYPHITDIASTLLSCIGYVCYALYIVMPLCIQRWEDRRWKSLISKI